VIVELTIPKQQLHCWPGAKAFASTITQKSTNHASTTEIHNNKATT